MAVLGLGLAAALAFAEVALLQPPLTAAARNYEIILERIEGHEPNPEYLTPDTFIRIRRSDKGGLPGLFHKIVIAKAWPNDTEAEVIMFEMRDNKPVPGWLKYKRNFCDYIANEKKPILNEIGNMYHFKPCPFQGTYKVDDWRPDEHLLPPVLPGPDRMMLGFKFTSGPTLILKYNVVFSVDRSKGKRGGRG
ncbi:uncharacterized protein LOC117651617 isoform X2 [Thrips palmi]|uniref:Uncharacterized protein LOC117651617 isoform X2 n=1 Tax=Thrips palmi TaxID=161013 RepID=A0A6P9A1L7_THRPL|nr:uncharacterized protein LOC117651617 isoform X2 [Thrips palmi]